MASWEEMAEQVLVLGRPGDVRGAAQGWDQLLRACDEVKANLEKHVKELNQAWKGPAYESFKTHINAISKQLGDMTADARTDRGIVAALNDAADKLETAQQNMPIPAVCTADISAARNLQADIPAVLFTVKLKSNVLHALSGNFLARAEYKLMDWFNNQEDAARKVYNQADGEYQTITYATPQGSTRRDLSDTMRPDTNPAVTGGGGGAPGVGGLGGGGTPPNSAFGSPSTGRIPSIGSGHSAATGPSTGSGFDPGIGGGLAGAGGGLSGAGLGSGGLGSAGLGGGASLSGAGGGLGGLSGGGAAGKAVMPSVGGLMGAGGAAGLSGGGGARAGARPMRDADAGRRCLPMTVQPR